MKRILISLCTLCILSACGQTGTLNTPTHIATIEPWTKTPEPTDTLTPTPSLTPTSTLAATATPDLTILGNPEKPLPTRWQKPSYSDKDFDVVQKTIHGRLVTMAWEKTANIPEEKRNEISSFYFQSFIMWWDIFQGFPYDSYTVVLKKNGNNRGETGVGYEATASDYAGTLDGHLKERISHEVFHAWVANSAVCITQEKKFDDGMWFSEGITQYYGDRGAGSSAYKDWMRDHFRIYREGILGTQYDIPLFDMPAKGNELGESPWGNRHYMLNVYWKGALVAYMMDERLNKSSLTLDDFLRYLYEAYALEQRCFTTQDALQALNKISGEDWTEFFEAYIYGNKELPLNGEFEYFNR